MISHQRLWYDHHGYFPNYLCNSLTSGVWSQMAALANIGSILVEWWERDWQRKKERGKEKVRIRTGRGRRKKKKKRCHHQHHSELNQMRNISWMFITFFFQIFSKVKKNFKIKRKKEYDSCFFCLAFFLYTCQYHDSFLIK